MSNKPKEAKSRFQKEKALEKARRELIEDTRRRWASTNEAKEGNKSFTMGIHEGFGVMMAVMAFPNGASMSWDFHKRDKFAARSLLNSFPSPTCPADLCAMSMLGKQVAMYVGDEEIWTELDEMEQKINRCMERKGDCDDCPECGLGDAAVKVFEKGTVH